jgi:hypothetical protein
MKQPKDFDCIQMKSDIQQQLFREIEELGEEEARRRQRERVMINPILGPFLRAKTAREISDEQKRKAS